GALNKLQSFVRPMSYLFSDALRSELRQVISAGYDILQLEQLWSAWLVPRDVGRSVVNVHYLFDIDFRGHVPEFFKSRVLQRRFLRAEKALLKRMSNICALSPRLTERIAQINPAAANFTIPLGIDISLYPFDHAREQSRPTVGLIGSFNWGPTLIAAQRLIGRLWPQIKLSVPNARLMLVGRQARKM